MGEICYIIISIICRERCRVIVMSIDKLFDDEMMNDMLMNPDLYGIDDEPVKKTNEIVENDYEEDEDEED